MDKMKNAKQMKYLLIITAATLLAACPTTKVLPYESDVCIVSGNKLGSMGTPVSIVYKGKKIKFCCSPCIKKFNKSPEKYLK